MKQDKIIFKLKEYNIDNKDRYYVEPKTPITMEHKFAAFEIVRGFLSETINITEINPEIKLSPDELTELKRTFFNLTVLSDIIEKNLRGSHDTLNEFKNLLK